MEICRKLKVKVKGNKEKLMKRINRAINPDVATERRIFEIGKRLNESQFKDRNPVNLHYKNTFNSINMIDKKYEQGSFNYKICNWKRRMVLSLLDVAVNNAHSIFL
jgi:hypothetical protein